MIIKCFENSAAKVVLIIGLGKSGNEKKPNSVHFILKYSKKDGENY